MYDMKKIWVQSRWTAPFVRVMITIVLMPPKTNISCHSSEGKMVSYRRGFASYFAKSPEVEPIDR